MTEVVNQASGFSTFVSCPNKVNGQLPPTHIPIACVIEKTFHSIHRHKRQNTTARHIRKTPSLMIINTITILTIVPMDQSYGG